MTLRQGQNRYGDFLEALIELREHSEYCKCKDCYQMETLYFVGDKLTDGLTRWKQLPDGQILHMCQTPY